MGDIDAEEARRYTECSDCEQDLYVYHSRDYPSDTGAICFNCLKARYEKLRDEVARLTPRPLDCFEVCDLFNAYAFKGRRDWRLFAEGDEPHHVGTEGGWGGYFDADVADAIAQALLRDGGKGGGP